MENGEHSTLILWAKMKKTVPRDDSIEPGIQAKVSHVCDDPTLYGKSAPANID